MIPNWSAWICQNLPLARGNVVKCVEDAKTGPNEVAEVARCKTAGLTVVAGGPLFTSEHEQFPDVDHFVLGEAENTLPHFLADLARGQAQRLYSADEFPEIQTTPVPLWMSFRA